MGETLPGPSSAPLLLVGEARTAEDRANIRAFVAAFPAGLAVVVKSAGRRRDLAFKGRAVHVYREDWTDPLPGAKALADRLIDDHRPVWAAAYGLETDHLVAALERRGVVTAVYIDKGPADGAFDARLYNTTRNASAIVFRDAATKRSFAGNGWSLEPRDGVVLSSDSSPGPVARKTVWSRLAARLGRPDAADFSQCVPSLTAPAQGAARLAACSARDHATILESGRFDAELFLGAEASGASPAEAVTAYLHASRLLVPRDRPLAGRLLRRPVAGFNPLIYATEAPGFDEAGEDPLAHFLRAGRPDGRWRHPVITASDASTASAERIALHGHFHYTDLFPDFLTRLRGQSGVDLFLTTSTEESRGILEDALAQEGLAAQSVTTIANRGRDLGPFFNLLRAGTFEDYPIVGHVHGKKSLFYDKGDLWRDFVWEHLIGGRRKMIDAVRAAFAADERLGLVYPEDPHLEGWEQNFERAGHLLARMGRTAPLPTHLDYPMGSMFWARPAALRPFLALDLADDTYPAEPLPNDGTILHTLERLFVFAAEIAGFHYATTRVAGSIR